MHRLRHVLERRRVVSAAPGESVHAVAARMSEAAVGAIPIFDGDRLVGIFSERDLMTRVVVPRRDPDRTAVGEVMTHEVVTATLDEHVDSCVDKMRRAGCRHLPVIASGRVIGVLSLRDLLRDELEEQDGEIRQLRAYLYEAPH